MTRWDRWLRVAFCVLALACGSVTARVAQADKTFLIGGTVIEGKATRHGDKVVIELSDGEISLPAESIERIETSESIVDQFQARYAKLRAGDVKARFVLADYCRDHDMRSREQQVLREILDIDANNEQARLRLGYVKEGSSWVTEDDAMHAKGMVKHDGQWMSQGQALELERMRAETEIAESHRDMARAELESRKAELVAEKAKLDAERNRLAQNQAQAAAAAQQQVATPAYYTPRYYGSYGAPARVLDVDGCGAGRSCEHRGYSNPYPFPIAGVRSPFDPSFSIPGVRDPRRGW